MILEILQMEKRTSRWRFSCLAVAMGVFSIIQRIGMAKYNQHMIGK